MKTMFKGARILAPHPWIYLKLARLQVDKWLFPHLESQAEKGYAKRIHQLSIRITDICNLRCHTCGQWGDSGFMHGLDLREKKKEEISPQRYIEILQDLTTNGHYPNVYIWGGEPMMYDGLFSVIENATRLGLPTSIATNGHQLSRSAGHLTEIPLFLLQVSIDGHTEEIHNRARPSAGRGSAFAEVVAGLAAIKEEKKRQGKTLPMVASLTVVSKNNVNHLIDIYTTFKKYVDVFVFYLSWWIDEQQAFEHETDFHDRFGFQPKLHRGWIGNWRPRDYEILAEQFRRLQKMSKGLSSPAVTFLPNLTGVEELERYYTNHRSDFGYKECISIYQAVELDSNGDMSPCRDYHDFVVGNIKEKSVTELWNSPAYRTFRKSLRNKGLMPVCRRCCGLMGY